MYFWRRSLDTARSTDLYDMGVIAHNSIDMAYKLHPNPLFCNNKIVINCILIKWYISLKFMTTTHVF